MSIAQFIDHTQLKPEANQETIIRYCQEAKQHGFASVCVNSSYMPLVKKELAGSQVKCCAVIGFPLGAMSTAAKAFEAKDAVKNGADEIDMVIHLGAIKSNNWQYVEEDIRQVVEAAKPAIVKVILETCLLNDEEITKACESSVQAGAAFVKTSTGFSTAGASIEHVRLMKKAVGDRCKIKASGGIRDPKFAKELLEAGADRIGASNGLALL